ncbi:thioredoxin-dependent thiol peroxidase [Scopulibacillus cellulosilyticus]|uniref:thioredoxin-dependent peroxiredoxin n=1 Tax=Scopulibacillus cellulosilyticus TaxID=2665665 RepID=A0ABW2Q0E9_9BACL
MILEAGQTAPDFTLKSTNGEEVTLSDFKGKNVVLYFYPKDMTPGCTTEACDFRDQHALFADVNTVVLGVSPDPVEKHQKFTEKHSLPFTLLADVDHEVAEKYGAWQLKKNFGKEYMGIQRSTFVIDKEGNIAKVWPNVKVKGHVEEVLQFIKENLAN